MLLKYLPRFLLAITSELTSRVAPCYRSIRRLIENRDVPFPKSLEKFISSSENKVNLATSLSNELMSLDVYEIEKMLQQVVSVILTKLHQLWDVTLTPLSLIMKKLTPELSYMQKRHQIRDMKD